MTDKIKCFHNIPLGSWCPQCSELNIEIMRDQMEHESAINHEKKNKNLAAIQALREIEFGALNRIADCFECSSCGNERNDDHKPDCPILKIWEALLY